MNSKVSIIVPVYNVEHELNRCLDSILNQTYTNFEVILVDDGSRDRSGEICDEYTVLDDRVRVFHISNSGVSNARNVGVCKALGDYVLFVDSDDEIKTNYIESFFSVDGIDRSRNLIFQGCICQGEDTITYYKCPQRKYIKEQFSECIANEELFKHGGPTGKLYSTKIINDNGIRFDTRLKNYEDLMFFLEYMNYIESIYFQPNLGYIYHIKKTGLHLSYSSLDKEELLLNQYNVKMRKYMSLDHKDRISAYSLYLFFRCVRSIYSEEGNKNTKADIVSFVQRYNIILSYPQGYLGLKNRIILRLIKMKCYNLLDGVCKLIW